jgi:ribose transport system substrate-binding protein
MRRTRGITGAFAIVIAATLVAACSSSSSNGGATSGATPGSGSQASVGGSAAAQAAAALQDEQQYLHTATKISQTIPLKSRPKAGQTFVYIQCTLPQCVTQGQGAKAAAEAIGWNYKSLSFDSANPAQFVSDMQRALEYHPVAVSFAGPDTAEFQSEIAAYKAANVAIIPMNTGPTVTIEDTVIADLEGPADNAHYASALSDWFISDSGAKGQVLLLDVPGFAILHEFTTAFQADVAKGCTACKVTTLSATIPEVEGGQLNSIIVSALRRDPSLTYLMSSDAAFLDTLPAALSAAGLSGKIKIAGSQGDSTGEHYLASGQMDAFTGLADNIEAWVAVDVAARYSEGMALPDPGDGGLPTQLILKSSDLPPANSYDYPTDYAAQFEKLWHVS